MGLVSNYLAQLPTHFSVKATLLRIIEVKLSKDGLDIRAALKQGSMKVSIDSEGNVSGDVGHFSLHGDPTLHALGAKFKFLSGTLSLADNGDIRYVVNISVTGAGGFIITNQFDVEKLLVKRGLLKGAYDALKNRQEHIDREVSDALR